MATGALENDVKLIKALVGLSGLFFPLSWIFLTAVLSYNPEIQEKFCNSGFYLYTTISIIIVILSMASFSRSFLRYLIPHVILLPLLYISIRMYIVGNEDPVMLLSYSVLLAAVYTFTYFYVGLLALSKYSSPKVQNSIYCLMITKLLIIIVGFVFIYKHMTTSVIFPGKEFYTEENGLYYILTLALSTVSVLFAVRVLKGFSEELLFSSSSIGLSRVVAVAWPIVSIPGYIASMVTVIDPRFSAILGMWIREFMAAYVVIALPTIFYVTVGLVFLLDIMSSRY
ncbi:MAG: hypothetical protein DRN30_04355 [Thermoplasmata archaeon]|nr:MAG: hypothetical protein DRN30_04355 [Thermoplasmata archaeon]